jgi:hypothetical protein
MAASFRQISILLVAFLQASLSLASSAQQSSQPPAVSSGTLQLTLKQAVQLALKQNPQRVIAQLLVSESDRNSQIVRSALLPQASERRLPLFLGAGDLDDARRRHQTPLADKHRDLFGGINGLRAEHG